MHPSAKIYDVLPGREYNFPFVDGIPRKLRIASVYIIDLGDTGFVKIGSTSMPRSRIGMYQTVSPFDVSCPYLFCPPEGVCHVQIERAAQAALVQHRVRGEWFKVPVRAAIEAVRAAV